MSWLKSLFGRSANDQAPPPLSPDTDITFDRLFNYLKDEIAQNDRLPPAARGPLKKGNACDHIPGGTGPFGKQQTNPIPVNGPLGELIYLSTLLFADRRSCEAV